jgi:hypothetical protein
MDKLSIVTGAVEEQTKSKNAGVRLRVLRYETAEFIIKPASSVAYQRFLEEMVDKDTRANAGRALVYACVVFPGDKELGAVLEQMPGLISVLADDCAVFSGVKAAAEKKDL